MLIVCCMESDDEQSGAYGEEWLAIPPYLEEREATGFLSERRAHLWALVLEARYLPCRIEPCGAGWRLLVPAEQIEAARQELRLFEAENRNWPPHPPPTNPLAENTLATLSVLILLATFHNLTQLDASLSGHYPVDWIALGNAHSARILDGQWWRLVTALTLHADWLHLFSNLTLGGIFIVSLCRELGAGLAWSLLLGSGILGNLANACLQLPTTGRWAPPPSCSAPSVSLQRSAWCATGAICKAAGRFPLPRAWPCSPCWERRGNRQIWGRTCSALPSA